MIPRPPGANTIWPIEQKELEQASWRETWRWHFAGQIAAALMDKREEFDEVSTTAIAQANSLITELEKGK